MYDDTGEKRPSELAWIEKIDRLVGIAQKNDVGIGDDTAVFDIEQGNRLLFSTDLLVENVHFDRSYCSDADIGWKALAVNVSDVAAMGGRPLRCVIGIAGANLVSLDELYIGILAAAERFDCAIVGGDCSTASSLVISIAVLGEAPPSGAVLRSGAQVGDTVFVSGPLGSSAAGLRLLQEDHYARGTLVSAHLRPVARIAQGQCAALGGATAMMDLSDGIGLDIHRLAASSKVGFALTDLPVANGALFDEAVAGGEDYELLFTAPDLDQLFQAFDDRGLERPIAVGQVVTEIEGVTLNGQLLDSVGYEHA